MSPLTIKRIWILNVDTIKNKKKNKTEQQQENLPNRPKIQPHDIQSTPIHRESEKDIRKPFAGIHVRCNCNIPVHQRTFHCSD